MNGKFKLLFVVLFCLQFSVVKSANNNVSSEMDKAIEQIVSSVQKPQIPNRVIILSDFAGHKADEKGSYDFYWAIRSAIDSLSAQGGGVLLFNHSLGQEAWIKQTEIYRVKGPIVLKSNIELRFEPSVKLFFEFSPSSYFPDNKPVLTRYEGTSINSYSPLIYAFNEQNIVISSTGGNGAMPIIDGDGESWQKWSYEGDKRIIAKGLTPAYVAIQTDFNEKDVPIGVRVCTDLNYHFLRPDLMQFVHCKQIMVEGVKLMNSPFWVVHPVFTTDFTMKNVKYDCQVVNNDGIDIESSQRVLVENVIFDNHDDNIAIKSGRDREGRVGALVSGSQYEKINSPYVKNGRITAPTSQVVVRNCVFKGHYAFCAGSEIAGGANNIYVTDCNAPMEVMMGVFLKSSRKRGGLIQNIFIRNLNFEQIENDALCIIPNYDGDSLSAYPPKFKNLYFENIQVKQAGNGIRIFGWKDAVIENVRLKNVCIDKVEDSDPNKVFLVNQIRKLILNRVTINGKRYDGMYNSKPNTNIPPKQN